MCNIIPSKDNHMYHLTHIENLESIIENGLMPRNVLEDNGISFTDVADKEIIYKRKKCANDLANYVLFHFDLNNAFDYNVCRRKGCDNMMILAVLRPQYWSEEAKECAYIYPSHPIGNENVGLYNYDEGYKLIRWDILDSDRWNNNSVVRKARMAECVVDVASIEINLIFVHSENARKVVESKLQGMGALNKVKVVVNRDMFPNCA